MDLMQQELYRWVGETSLWVQLLTMLGLLVALGTCTVFATHFLLTGLERLVTSLQPGCSTGRSGPVSDGGGEMPEKSQAQRALAYAVLAGKSKKMPKKVAKKFTAGKKGLPKKVRKRKHNPRSKY